jgi:chaperone BCS1
MAKDTIFVSQEIEKNVFDSCERFLKSADEYKKVGDPWTLGFLLYGLPGTGKTSIIQVLAKEHGLDIFSICLSLCNTTNDIVTVFNSIRNLVLSRKIKSYIVALEDFDRSSFFTNEKISIDVFLNSINGIVPDSGRILFITCNDKAVIDKNPAIIRPGRIDIVAEIGIANEYQYVNCLRMYGIIKQTETTIPKGIPKGLTIAQLKEHIRRIAPELQKIK